MGGGGEVRQVKLHAHVVCAQKRQKSFSSPEPTIILTCGRNRELWEQPFQACAIDADCVKFGYFLCYFKMVAPRALVFRPLVKGNEALGTRLGMDDGEFSSVLF